MGYRRNAGGGKRDASEGPIVAALEAVGVRVWRLGGTGNPDILTLYKGRWRPFELKSGKAGRLTINQQDLAWSVIRDVDQALREFGVGR